MGNNKEIRKRIDSYREALLLLNWLFAIGIVIYGITMANSHYTQEIGYGVIIAGVIIGLIGHSLINVALAIPFILLNNGDILESIKEGNSTSSIANSAEK